MGFMEENDFNKLKRQTIQQVFCEVCKAKLIIPLEANIDVYSAILIITDAHREISPKCQNPVEGLRLIK